MNNLTVTEHNGIRVLTTQQIADAYGTDAQVITNNFNRNKDRYVEGKHFICLTREEKAGFINKNQNDFSSYTRAKAIYLWTKKGAFLHAKSLNTDRAWEVYDHLVDIYFDKKKPLTLNEQIQLLAQGNTALNERVDMVDGRVTDLENNMTLDYGQQVVIGDEVNKVVINALSGKNSAAYKEIGRKVFSECNSDIKHYFHVNARNNIPKKRFDEAVQYIQKWHPCTNTQILINEINSENGVRK